MAKSRRWRTQNAKRGGKKFALAFAAYFTAKASARLKLPLPFCCLFLLRGFLLLGHDALLLAWNTPPARTPRCAMRSSRNRTVKRDYITHFAQAALENRSK